MKRLKAAMLILLVSITTVGCFEDNDDSLITASEINDFVWKGMNVFYLYKDEIPNLVNDRFSSNQQYADYLNTFFRPEELFESLIYQRQTVDKFSWITQDYYANDDLLNGKDFTNGMQFTFIKRSETDPVRYGIVLYVLPNSSADLQGVKRGDIFYAVDGNNLYYNSSIDNNYALLNANTYSINLGTYDTNGTPETDDDFVIPLNQSIFLTKEVFTENPIHVSKTLTVDSKTIGYLMYNGFNGSSLELNNAFATFQSAGIEELVLDLRYNLGGYNSKAILLSSLITGQFNGEVLSQRFYNNEIQSYYEAEDPEFLLDSFINNENGMTLNSLNLNKVYIITSTNTASASELVINSLNPYIDVVQIGTNTRGKYQGSFTVYDSPDFQKSGANPSHTYALQPLVFKYANIEGNTDFLNGLEPDITLSETRGDLGVLGDKNEPLLAEAISQITGTGKFGNLKGNITTTDEIKLLDADGVLINDQEFPKAALQKLLSK